MPAQPATGELRGPMDAKARPATGCPIPDCSRCRPENSPRLTEAVQKLHQALTPAPRAALLAFGLPADGARNTH